MTEKIMLWNSDEMVARSGSGMGTFESCSPGISYYPARGKKTGGCIIICPGGAYMMKSSEKEGTDVAEFLNNEGFDAFVLDYRIKPDYHPSPMKDVFKAIEKVREMSDELGYKPDKIAVMGFSAGGHLAACAATMWSGEISRPDAVILCYPVITMGKYANIDSKSNLFGENISQATCDDMSAENRVDRQTPPAFIWHTSDDKAVSVENSLLFASALSAKSVPFELHVFPHGEHGLGLAKGVESVDKWPEHCINWLRSLGF